MQWQNLIYSRNIMESESGYINRLYLFNVLAVVCTKYYIGDTGSFGSQNFSFIPPTGNTLPRRVISPVIARRGLTGRPVMADKIDVHIVIPADGPSFGIAPSGT